ncbi:hypothetical protein PB01_04245 [Psychrobacillus glaciei]|uniref:histidine kinase n=1 Tax=Psychrobacillus glaciei TaxID=2283160 RepID=A0A5J6SK59_9BACI|nr:sensor histidine kinase [Psychrobacillus glaciei]QFF98089.1 hypothetical protein PB01_04245 [Psychrobacillus glaciei]
MNDIFCFRILLSICSFIFLFGSIDVYAKTESIPEALNGKIDLSSIHHFGDKISLEGQWELYKNKLLTPEQIMKTMDVSEYVFMPEVWRTEHKEAQLNPKMEYGTYRLNLKLSSDEVDQHRAIYISDFASAYMVWIDGKMLGGSGTVGQTITEEVPESKVKLFYFVPERQDVEIVIQASNFSSRNEGTFKSVMYGDEDSLLAYTIKSQLLKVLTMGGLLVIGLYHLIIFMIKKRDGATFYIALLALDIGIRCWIKNTYLVDIIAPSLSWEMVVKLDYLTGYLAYLFLVMLMKNMFPMEMNRYALFTSNVMTLLFCLYIVVSPADVYTQTLTFQFAIMLMFSIYTIGYVCILAVKRKREGSLINLIGYAIIAVVCVNDVLLYQRVIETVELLYEAIFIFVLLQAIIVSYRYSKLFEHNVSLSSDLLQLNETLEHKIAERTADIHRKNEELATMHQSRTEMLANISHDMGSPLTGIQMNIQLMKDGIVNPQQHPEFVQSLFDKANYVKRLNDDLFELSTLESGHFSFQFRLVQLKTFMEEVCRKYQVDLASQHIQFQVDKMETLLDGQEAWLDIEPMRIKQVLENYIGNAVKFSRDISSTIVLACYIERNSDSDAVTPYEVVIEVKDRGPGVAEEDLPYVFDRFYRKTEEVVSGSGLGLAIVKEIIEQHEGHVNVTSKIGEGSIFSFSLPVYLKE